MRASFTISFFNIKFAYLYGALNGQQFGVGDFLVALVAFIIVALVVFLIVKIGKRGHIG